MSKCSLRVRDLAKTVSIRNTSKKINRSRSFHFRYMELCRSKNVTPLIDIRNKSNATSILDFFGDKLNANDWLLIIEALYYDQVLQKLSVRMRKAFGIVLEQLDTEKKAKLFRQKPVIYTKYIFNGVVEAISNCIGYNKNLRVLNLEGLPLNDKYIELIAKGLSSNEGLKEISFQRSNIFDKGCEAVCNTIKYLDHIEKLNLSECSLTTKGAEFIADMIKIQKISRYTEGWQKSLRYRDVNPDTIPGLRFILLSNNPQIGDEGLKHIVEVLKEDVWIKVIDMVQCGLTDRGANMILDCLEINNNIYDFNVQNNNGISKFLHRSIRNQLGKEYEEQRTLDGSSETAADQNGVVGKRSKLTVAQLKEKLKTMEEQLALEKVLRKKAEQLNEKLNLQINSYEDQLEHASETKVPDGFVLVKNESLQSIIRERNELRKLFDTYTSQSSTPRIETFFSLPIKNNTKQFMHRQMKDNNLCKCNTINDNSFVDYTDEGTPDDNEDFRYVKTNEFDEYISYNSPKLPPSIVSISTKTPTPKILTVEKGKRITQHLRKVRSEIKYVESVQNKDMHRKKNKESKSDQEFCNGQCDLIPVQIETNIGDSITNKPNNAISYIKNTDSGRNEHSSRTLTSSIANHNNSNGSCCRIKRVNYNAITKSGKNFSLQTLSKYDIDDISIPTTPSSDLYSSDSDTLRNDNANTYQPLKVFIKRQKKSQRPLTPIPICECQSEKNNSHIGCRQQQHSNSRDNSNSNSQLDNHTKQRNSPRSLFFGITH